MSKIKQFIRNFLILTILCVLPVFVYADEEPVTEVASIKIEVNLTTGTPDGSFNYKIKEIVKTTNPETGEVTTELVERETVNLITESGTKSEVVANLKANTEYVIEQVSLPDAYEFVSLESGSKIITNSQAINITTGEADSITTVSVLNTAKGAGMETNKTTEPIPDPITGLDSGKSKLSLSVTGKANTTSSRSNANILIVNDTSTSMLKYGIPEEYGNYYCGLRSGSGVNYSDPPLLYKRTGNNRYTQLRADEAYTGTVYHYSGGRYSPVTERCSIIARADAAEKTVYDFINDIFSYQNAGTDNIEMAYITFSGSNNPNIFRYGTDNKAWTSNKYDIIGPANNPSFSTDGSYRSHKQGYGSGTNWEAALRGALTVLDEADADPTYIIFVTDGQPFNKVDPSNFPGVNTQNVYYYAATDEARSIQTFTHESLTASNTTFYSIYAFGTEDDYLDDLTYYAYNGQERANVSGATTATENYFNANNAGDLNDAISAIFRNITETAGFNNVSIEDGTTSQVKVTSSGGTASLLEVNADPSTFTYWLSMPVTPDGNNYKLTRKNRETGNNETITFTQGGEGIITATWGERIFNLEGSIEDNVLKYKWTTEAFYDFDKPTLSTIPPAEYNTETGAIDWDLSTLGKLINDVTYTVDVEVWPSQYTQDLIADLRNNPDKYDTLDDGIKDYIVRDGDNFTLRTNTKALVSYTDSNDKPGTSKINNPPPIGTKQNEIAVKKEWPEGSNTLDPEDYNEDKYDHIELYIKRDAEILPDTITLNKVNNWERNVFLSMGIIEQTYSDSNNTIIESVKIIEKGHDYSFTEKDYHWNLEIRDNKIVHPMLINGVPTTLIKSNKTASDIGIGTATFKVYEGVTYYQICKETCSIYEPDSGPNTGKVIAENYRRSNLNIKKEVIGDYDGTDEFEFTLKVKGTEDLWFSVADTTDPNPDNAVNVKTATIVGARLSIDRNTGDYYYVIEGVNQDTFKEVKVSLQENWNIRFTNIPKTTVIEVVESNIPAGSSIVFEGIQVNDSSLTKDLPNLHVMGNLDKSNTLYQIIYQNRYLLTNVTATKTWLKDGVATTDNIPNNITIKLIPSTGEEADNNVNTITLNNDNNWTHTWSGLTKYVWNNTTKTYDEITYSVIEKKINNKDIPSDKKFAIRDKFNAIIGRWLAGEPTPATTDSGTNYTITNTWQEAQKENLSFAKIAFGTNLNGTTDASSIPTLNGAVFKLYRYLLEGESGYTGLVDDNTANWKLFAISNGDGRFSFDNLYAGEYRLVEVSSPSGYILPGGQWKIVISESADGTLSVGTPISIENATAITLKDNTYYVYNEHVPEMPSTGSRGIIDFSLIGLILMALGSFFLIINQKEKI